MATETVTPATDPLAAAESALNDANLRAEAVLSILDKYGFYDLAAAGGEEAYAMLSLVELCIQDVLKRSRDGLDAIDASRLPQSSSEVTHG